MGTVMDFQGWRLRWSAPAGPGPHPALLLLHGWTGDENAMWVFTRQLARQYVLLAPRGLYATPQGGFGWQSPERQAWPSLADLRPAAESLMELLSTLDFPQADFARLSVMGFSQGAALAYTLALLYPQRVRAVAGLAGFVPQGAETLVEGRPLAGKALFIAHGTQDEVVLISYAHLAAELLARAGAEVNFCESEVGHKLGAICFREMEAFFNPHGC